MTEDSGSATPADGYQLSLNEMPDVPVAGLGEALRESLREVNRYPDPFSRRLTESIAATHATPVSDVVVGPGSAAILQHVIQWAAPHCGEVIHAWPSFDAYRLVVDAAGAKPVEVPLRDHRHDLSRMLESITGDTRAIVLCNPHNPTGTVVGSAEMSAFLREIPERIVVVLDEAYREFAGDHPTPDGRRIYRSMPNLVVLRSFSKAYGMAGLRVGYALTQSSTAQILRGRVLPFSVSTVAEAAARTALGRRAEVMRHVDLVIAERDRVEDELRHRGWDVVPSAANFVWLPMGSGAATFAAEAARHGLRVRAVHDLGVRVTVGSPQANDALLRFAERFSPRPAPSRNRGPRPAPPPR
ncbi:aminotransferase class I/II-fold pyridoxal phosphate-dependent enzyme [Streptomyces sp. MUM 203J]|uniref:aminotransferase class I/II-fold pyridoxal phosphate-dependent enzyme n=1 Tax=Streptomyces sp. MUM 203J TaxID=2791990 RepID=UPI001F04CD39|nr:aminotransferase class I/II-fold pyridoxal phosphate-dependent enzyme [Streptomyces sp. MUM 203J]MCH0541420.1 aminotransferase class I/II-fold pyridoxal phosphate-dependent enzyme [Streptomyces sp. MUM 203J]